jgi:hypothetical protein
MKLFLFLIGLCHLLNAQDQTPILEDGSEVLVLKFTIPTQKDQEALSIALDLDETTRLEDISEIILTHLRKAGDRFFASTKALTKELILKSPLIFPKGNHNCHTFRIPGIAKATNENFLAVADMRYNSRRDLQEHIDIDLRISKDKGQTCRPCWVV